MRKAIRFGFAAAVMLTCLPAWAQDPAPAYATGKEFNKDCPKSEGAASPGAPAKHGNGGMICQVGSACDLVNTAWSAG